MPSCSEVVNTAIDSPYGELFAISSASSALLILITGATGPNVSSCAISMSVVTPVRIVGS